MTKKEVEEFITRREKHNQLTIDEWTKRDKEETKWFDIAYWVVVGKQRERVRAIGNSLEECVEKALVKENLLEKENKDKKGKSSKSK